MECSRLCRDCRWMGHNLESRNKWLFMIIPIFGWVALALILWGERPKYSKCRRIRDTHHLMGYPDFFSYCEVERTHGDCGVEGKHWQPKNALLKNLSNKQLMGECLHRGLANVMKDYKRETDG